VKSTEDKSCICNKEGTSQCQYCGYYFCSDHVTPSLHNCIGIDWETDEIKKQITQEDRSRWLKNTRPELVKSLSSGNVPSSFRPKGLNFIAALKKVHRWHFIYLGIALVLTIVPIVVVVSLSYIGYRIGNPFWRCLAANILMFGNMFGIGMLMAGILFGRSRWVAPKKGGLKYVLIFIFVCIYFVFAFILSSRGKYEDLYEGLLALIPVVLGALVGLELWHVLRERFQST